MFIPNIILSLCLHYLFDFKQWCFSLTSSCHCLPIIYLMLCNDVSPQHILSIYNIIFGVTVGNADRKVRKIKVGAQIIARRWYEKPAAQTPSQKSLSWH